MRFTDKKYIADRYTHAYTIHSNPGVGQHCSLCAVCCVHGVHMCAVRASFHKHIVCTRGLSNDPQMITKISIEPDYVATLTHVYPPLLHAGKRDISRQTIPQGFESHVNWRKIYFILSLVRRMALCILCNFLPLLLASHFQWSLPFAWPTHWFRFLYYKKNRLNCEIFHSSEFYCPPALACHRTILFV